MDNFDAEYKVYASIANEYEVGDVIAIHNSRGREVAALLTKKLNDITFEYEDEDGGRGSIPALLILP